MKKSITTIFCLIIVLTIFLGCSSSNQHTHGKISTLSAASSEDYHACEHKVPKEVCTQCNPHLVQDFKKVGDWCPEHSVPESQCFKCHPDLNFAPLPELPDGADIKEISAQGEDVPSLEPHAINGKITLFDFYAVWCSPCREIDRHVYSLLNTRNDIAVRKLNVVSWTTPLAKRYLQNVNGLPYLRVYDKEGKFYKDISGFDLQKLDNVIAEIGAKDSSESP